MAAAGDALPTAVPDVTRRNDPLAIATFWALRSVRRQKAGEHAHDAFEIERVFATEWNLSPEDRQRLSDRISEETVRRRDG